MIVTQRNARPRRGSAAVELAIVMPFILVLLLGIWEVGRLIDVNQILSNAAREGARQSATGLATSSQVKSTVLQYLKNNNISTGNAVVTVSDLTSPGTDPTGANQLDQLQVTVTIPVQDVRWINLYLVTNSTSQLSGQAVWCSEKDQDYPSSVTAPPGY